MHDGFKTYNVRVIINWFANWHIGWKLASNYLRVIELDFHLISLLKSNYHPQSQINHLYIKPVE